MRESAHIKSRRLLTEGRIRVVTANEDDGHVTAEVRGDSARIYTVTFEAGDGGWGCDCPTRGLCSHIRAVMLIVVTAPTESTA